jgi:hypothetical protein
LKNVLFYFSVFSGQSFLGFDALKFSDRSVMILAIILFTLFGDLGKTYAMKFDTSSILFPDVITQMTILIGIAAYARYISIRGAKMFGGRPLDF